MPITKITGQGLAAIALSVALLWACIIGQRAMARAAVKERARVLHDLHLMQQKPPQPVSVPVPWSSQHHRPIAG
jgi:hypothetical protein